MRDVRRNDPRMRQGKPPCAVARQSHWPWLDRSVPSARAQERSPALRGSAVDMIKSDDEIITTKRMLVPISIGRSSETRRTAHRPTRKGLAASGRFSPRSRAARGGGQALRPRRRQRECHARWLREGDEPTGQAVWQAVSLRTPEAALMTLRKSLSVN